MDLKIYYDKIVDEIKSFNFKIIQITEPAPEKISPHLEAINYIIYDWNRDNNDDRDLEFEYVIQPESDINLGDKEKISFEEFFNFIIKTKTDENVLVETKDIEVISDIEKIKEIETIGETIGETVETETETVETETIGETITETVETETETVETETVETETVETITETVETITETEETITETETDDVMDFWNSDEKFIVKKNKIYR